MAWAQIGAMAVCNTITNRRSISVSPAAALASAAGRHTRGATSAKVRAVRPYRAALGASLVLSACTLDTAKPVLTTAPETVMASYYGPGLHGQRTASGEIFSRHELTAAHRTYPFGTRLKVVNPENGQQVVVRVNDRGPFRRGYSLDLSEAAAFRIGRLSSGPVEVSLLD